MKYQRFDKGEPTHPKRDTYSEAANDGEQYEVYDSLSLFRASEAVKDVKIKEFIQ